ncbi:MAG: acyl-ACP--UDP-N-acetylglucosamine O-acyltransferase [Acidobacteriota bacterium]
MSLIDPSAHVDAGADLATGVTVGPGAIIEQGVIVGRGSRIGPYAVLMKGTRLGEQVRVEAGAALGGAPQDLKFEGGDSFVTIGDRTIIREYVTVHRCVRPGGITRVGADCMLMATSHVAHECVVGDGVMVANGVTLAGYVQVGDRAFLSGNVVVHQFVRVGRLAMVGGGSAVRQDIVPFCLADGHPARPCGLNGVGLRRADFSEAEVGVLKAAYRVLFGAGRPLAEALAQLDEMARNRLAAIAELADFIRASDRGIARPRGVDDSAPSG